MPETTPSSETSIRSAAGLFGIPGMVMMSPQRATTNPAPALIERSVTVRGKPFGRPKSLGLSYSEYCVLATQTGSPENPLSSNRFSFFRAGDSRTTRSAP